jgi:hypothetical protein
MMLGHEFLILVDRSNRGGTSAGSILSAVSSIEAFTPSPHTNYPGSVEQFASSPAPERPPPQQDAFCLARTMAIFLKQLPT